MKLFLFALEECRFPSRARRISQCSTNIRHNWRQTKSRYIFFKILLNVRERTEKTINLKLSSCLNDRSISSSSTAGVKFHSSNFDRARNFLLLRCWIPVKTGWKFDKIEIYTDEARFGLRQVSLISERSADYSQDTALTGATCWFNRASQVTRATLRASGTTWRASSDLLSRVSV